MPSADPDERDLPDLEADAYTEHEQMKTVAKKEHNSFIGFAAGICSGYVDHLYGLALLI